MAEQDYNPDRDLNDQVVVPVVSEELHADAIPVTTGSVRVVKRVDGHEEILEQELRRGRVEVKRVKTNRAVDGPQTVQRQGNTLIIPVVSEVLRVSKEWVVTEEIHITQIEETERVQERVQVNRETAEIERTDDEGNIVRESAEARASSAAPVSGRVLSTSRQTSTRKVLSDRKSLLGDR
jgi:uncharacterized protein (TIGR02271 family)